MDDQLPPEPGTVFWMLCAAAIHSEEWGHLTASECRRLLAAFRPLGERLDALLAAATKENDRG